jgi:hypothetical protein
MEELPIHSPFPSLDLGDFGTQADDIYWLLLSSLFIVNMTSLQSDAKSMSLALQKNVESMSDRQN